MENILVHRIGGGPARGPRFANGQQELHVKQISLETLKTV